MPRTKQVEVSDYRKSSYWKYLWYPKPKGKPRGKTWKPKPIDPNACPFCDGELKVVDLRTDLPRPCVCTKSKAA
jgi:hypothetical protein